MKIKIAERRRWGGGGRGSGGGGALQDRTNHPAITLTTVTKRGLLIAAATCATLPIPERNLQLRVGVCLSNGLFLLCTTIRQRGYRPAFHTAASTTRPQSSLALCISPLLEDMASCSPFPVLLRAVPLPVPPLSRIVCQVPMADRQKQKNGGRRNNSWRPYGLHFA